MAPALPDTVGVVKMFRKGQSHAVMSFCIRSEQCCHHSRNGPLSTRRDADILVRNSPTHLRRHLPPPQTYTCLMPKVGEQIQYNLGLMSGDKFSVISPKDHLDKVQGGLYAVPNGDSERVSCTYTIYGEMGLSETAAMSKN